MGPRDPRSTVLTPAEEAVIVLFRQCTLLPLDDVMGCLREQMLKLTRSSLHLCLQRHGISRLPETDGGKPARKRFRASPPASSSAEHGPPSPTGSPQARTTKCRDQTVAQFRP